MLVVSRRRGQEVVVKTEECDIRIAVVDFAGTRTQPQVKLGIDAPRGVPILRAEIEEGSADDDDGHDYVWSADGPECDLCGFVH